MRGFRIVIADDEPMARRRLRRLIGIRSDCEVIGEFADGVSLSTGMLTLRPDVLLLDVDMPGADGFASLATLPAPKPLVIFVTAFSEFAARAYDVDAVDYLLKPVSGGRLGEALARATRRRDSRPSDPATAIQSTIARFAVQGRIYLIEQAHISTLRAMGNYVEITTHRRRYELRMTLAEAYARLDASHFRRVHRSWVVARAAVEQITSLPGGRAEILLQDGRRIPGGRAFQSGKT